MRTVMFIHLAKIWVNYLLLQKQNTEKKIQPDYATE